MSVLIKGMEMPKNCNSCDLIQFDDEGLEAHCPLSPYYRWCGTPPDYRPEGCPLVEIPTPHGRLIDADTNVGSYVETWTCNCSKFGTQRVMAADDLKYLPTIIEAEVSK